MLRSKDHTPPLPSITRPSIRYVEEIYSRPGSGEPSIVVHLPSGERDSILMNDMLTSAAKPATRKLWRKRLRAFMRGG